MDKTKRLIILGDSAFAEIAHEYFNRDSEYRVVAFSVESEYMKRNTLSGLPIIPFEEVEERFAPDKHYFYAAMVYTQLNRLRTRMYETAKDKGFLPASYISSSAFVWHNVEIGEHCFIFEDNTIQPFVKIGNNVVLWSGNHIGHHSVIRDNCFISSHVVISGFDEIGENCFIGVNATMANNIVIEQDCMIGAGAIVGRNVQENSVVKGVLGEAKKGARRLFKVN